MDISSFTDEAELPYKLTGYDILHRQGYKGDGVNVAILDTGVDYNHDDLKGHIAENRSFIYYGDGLDDVGHGTHVASTVVRLAPECAIYNYKVMAGPDGSGEDQDLIDCLNYIYEQGKVDVISMSLSGKYDVNSQIFKDYHEIIKKLHDANVYINVSSGNTGMETELYPACFEEVTTWGAVDIYRNEAWFSTLSDQVDVCQVGVDLVAAKLGGGYISYSGTSMSTPIGSGLVALLIGKYKKQHNGKRPDGSMIHAMLKLFAVDLNIKGIDTKTGAGFISFNPGASIVKYTMNSRNYFINGELKTMDTVPYIDINAHRILIPVRFGKDNALVLWDGATKEATVVG